MSAIPEDEFGHRFARVGGVLSMLGVSPEVNDALEKSARKVAEATSEATDGLLGQATGAAKEIKDVLIDEGRVVFGTLMTELIVGRSRRKTERKREEYQRDTEKPDLRVVKDDGTAANEA